MGIANSLFTSAYMLIPSTLSMIISGAVVKAIKNAFAGQTTDEAVADAVPDALGDAVADELIDEATSTALAELLVSATLGLFVGVIIFALTAFILNYLVKTFQLQITIYNWDLYNTWTIAIPDVRDNVDAPALTSPKPLQPGTSKRSDSSSFLVPATS